MIDYEATMFGILIAVFLMMLGVFIWVLRDQSRHWRHLVQLYYEARLHKQLPVDVPPGDSPSSLTLPKDLQSQLEARNVERDYGP